MPKRATQVILSEKEQEELIQIIRLMLSRLAKQTEKQFVKYKQTHAA